MKALIDKYIESNYKKLVCIAQTKITLYNKNLIAEDLVSDAYLYVLSQEIDKEEDIPRYLVNYMNIEIIGSNSNTNRKWKVNNLSDVVVKDDAECFSVLDEFDFYNTIEDFVKKLDRQHQIVWDVYFNKGKRKIKELAEHFEISMNDAYKYRRQVLDKLKEYYEDQD